jgi:hypothetical protein
VRKYFIFETHSPRWIFFRRARNRTKVTLSYCRVWITLSQGALTAAEMLIVIAPGAFANWKATFVFFELLSLSVVMRLSFGVLSFWPQFSLASSLRRGCSVERPLC